MLGTPDADTRCHIGIKVSLLFKQLHTTHQSTYKEIAPYSCWPLSIWNRWNCSGVLVSCKCHLPLSPGVGPQFVGHLGLWWCMPQGGFSGAVTVVGWGNLWVYRVTWLSTPGYNGQRQWSVVVSCGTSEINIRTTTNDSLSPPCHSAAL